MLFFAFQTNYSSYPFLVGFADQTGNIVLAEQVVLWSDVVFNPDGLYDTTTGKSSASLYRGWIQIQVMGKRTLQR